MKRSFKVFFGIKVMDKLFLLGVSILVLTLIVMLKAQSEEYSQSQMDTTLSYLEAISNNQETQFNNFISDKFRVLSSLTQFTDINSMDRGEQRVFLLTKVNTLGFNELFILDNDGNGYYILENKVREQGDEPFFEIVSKEDKYVTEPFYTLNGPIVTLCKSIYNKRAERVGTLCGTVYITDIQKQMEQNDTLYGGMLFIINSDGEYLADADNKKLLERTCIYDTENSELSLLKSTFEKKEDVTGEITLDGIEYLVAINYMEDYSWALVNCIAKENVDFENSKLAFLQKILFGVLFVLSIALIIIIYSWKASDRKIMTDSLCRCGSRAACAKWIARMGKKRKTMVGIAYCDLNNFKHINDEYGHSKGDELIIQFSDALIKTFEKYGFVGRMGGDEFIVIFIDTDYETIENGFIKINDELADISRSFDLTESKLVSTAYGIALSTKDNPASMKELLQLADTKMYEKKQKMKATTPLPRDGSDA